MKPLQLKIWDVATGKEHIKLPDDRSNWGVLTSDGKTLAYGRADPDVKANQIVLWDLAAGKECHGAAGQPLPGLPVPLSSIRNEGST